MGTAIKHPVPDWVKQSFVILTSGHSDAQGWASQCSDVENYKWQLNPFWHRMLYSCTHVTTVGLICDSWNGLTSLSNHQSLMQVWPSEPKHTVQYHFSQWKQRVSQTTSVTHLSIITAHQSTHYSRTMSRNFSGLRPLQQIACNLLKAG